MESKVGRLRLGFHAPKSRFIPLSRIVKPIARGCFIPQRALQSQCDFLYNVFAERLYRQHVVSHPIVFIKS